MDHWVTLWLAVLTVAFAGGGRSREQRTQQPYVPPVLHCSWLSSENETSIASIKRTTAIAAAAAPLPVPVFWINMAESTARRAYMEAMLLRLGPLIGLGAATRIAAITPESPNYNVSMLEQPCKRNVPRDLAVISSHLTAIYRAVHDTRSRSPFALILEDDVSLPLHVSIHELVASAPAGWGILQLTTSSREGLHLVWRRFVESRGAQLWTLNHWSNTTRDGRYPLFWSAQGYLINKAVVRGFLDDVVEAYVDSASPADQLPQLSFKLVNSFFPQRCQRTKVRPCVLSNCLFSDSYIFAGGGPSYVSNVPVLNGGSIGKVSTVHQEHVERVHVPVFDAIRERIDALKREWEGHRGLGAAGSLGLGGAFPPFVVPPPDCKA